jgi:hypothetical protein
MGVSFTWIAADLPYIEHLIKENLKPWHKLPTLLSMIGIEVLGQLSIQPSQAEKNIHAINFGE